MLLPEWPDDVDVYRHPSIEFITTFYGELTSLVLTDKETKTLRASMFRSQLKQSNEMFIR